MNSSVETVIVSAPEDAGKVERFVKGNVIVDYCRMIRTNPHLPWADHLLPEDIETVNQLVLPLSWYPLEQFQRIGLAVFKLLSNEDHAVVHAYGNSLADRLRIENPGIVSEGQPCMTLRRYYMIHQRFYSFKANKIKQLEKGLMIFDIYSTSEDVGIPVYIEQISGTMERLIEFSGGRNVRFQLLESVLEGMDQNTLKVTWEDPQDIQD